MYKNAIFDIFPLQGQESLIKSDFLASSLFDLARLLHCLNFNHLLIFPYRLLQALLLKSLNLLPLLSKSVHEQSNVLVSSKVPLSDDGVASGQYLWSIEDSFEFF